MSRRAARLDRPQHISTLQLLAVIDRYGRNWPAELSDFALEAVSTAVGREILAGNLVDGTTLTRQGRETLRDAGAEAT